MDCPVCQSNHFYVKDPADEFEIYELECRDGRLQYDDDDVPDVGNNPEIYCQRCAWHGKVPEKK